MSKTSLFAQFLSDNAILAEDDKAAYIQYILHYENSEAPDPAPELQNDVDAETRLIFGLADFFKSQDSGKCYDMAERLYKKWEATQKATKLKGFIRIIKRRLWNSLYNAMNVLKTAGMQDTVIEKDYPQTTRPKSHIEPDFDPAELRRTYSTRVSPPYTKPQSQRNTIEPRSSSESVFDKLHSIARTRQELSKMKEQMRDQKELEYCTFHPQLATEKSPYRKKTSKNPYTRLSYSNKKERLEYLEAQKAALELQYCTFSPSLPNKKRHGRSLSQGEAIYTRLHKQGELLEQARRCKEVAVKDKELDGCTFNPKTNWRRNRSSSLSAKDIIRNPYERLYKDHERKKREIEKNQLDHEEALSVGCTFKPTLVSRSQTGESLIEEPEPRYKRLYSKHLQKKQLLEQKRKELEQEARKMHETVERMRSGKSRTPNISRSKSARSLHESFGGKRMSDTFDRLHSRHKENVARKEVLAQKILRDQGATFNPAMNSKSIQLVENDKRGVLERNNSFIMRREMKIARGLPTGMKECTFRPKVLKPTRGEENRNGDIVERLQSYLEYYEKRKEEYKSKLYQ